MPDGDTLLGVSMRLPPANPQAEQALLGALLANNKAFDRVGSFLLPEHFADPIHGRIYAEISRRVAAGQLADPLSLKAAFEHTGILQEVGGIAYLGQLLSAMVGIINAGEYGRAVHDTWVRRQVIDIGETMVNAAFGTEPDVDGAAVVTQAVEALLGLGEQTLLPEKTEFSATLDAILGAADAAQRGEGPRGLYTGIGSLDRAWRGLWGGSLDILGARSEHGKTALGMQIAQSVAARLRDESADSRSPGQVQIFSLEMPARDLGIRMLAAETGVPSDDIRCGNLTVPQAADLVRARQELASLPLDIQDKPGQTASEICTKARIAARRKHTRLIIIDHLHRIAPERRMMGAPRVEQVQASSAMIKDLARTLDVPVLLLAQLSRHLERREDQRPVAADLQYASERDADNIALLWQPGLHLSKAAPEKRANEGSERFAERQDAWQATLDRWKGRAEIIFGKRRFGPAGTVVELGFDGPRTRFFDLEKDGQGDLGGWGAP